MSDLERPRAPTSLKLTSIVVLGLLAWVLFGSALSVGRAVIALIGYVVVGYVAFKVGTFVGRRSRDG